MIDWFLDLNLATQIALSVIVGFVVLVTWAIMAQQMKGKIEFIFDKKRTFRAGETIDVQIAIAPRKDIMAESVMLKLTCSRRNRSSGSSSSNRSYEVYAQEQELSGRIMIRSAVPYKTHARIELPETFETPGLDRSVEEIIKKFSNKGGVTGFMMSQAASQMKGDMNSSWSNVRYSWMIEVTVEDGSVMPFTRQHRVRVDQKSFKKPASDQNSGSGSETTGPGEAAG